MQNSNIQSLSEAVRKTAHKCVVNLIKKYLKKYLKSSNKFARHFRSLREDPKEARPLSETFVPLFFKKIAIKKMRLRV
jgi:hypothetical protein